MNGWFVAVELHVRARPTASWGLTPSAPGPRALEHARARGLSTVVLAHDPGHYDRRVRGSADLWVRCDTRDAAAVERACRALPGPVAAVTSSVDTFVGPAATAARALGLRGPTPGTAALARDKAVARAALRDAGVPDVRWGEVAAGAPRLTSPLGYPCVAKPVDGASSWDVELVHDDGQLQALAARHLTRAYGRGVRPRRRLLCEEFVPGPLWSAEGVVRDGRAEVLAWSGRVLTPVPCFAELAVLTGVAPPSPEAPAFVDRVLDALGLDAGAFHLELVLGPDGPRLVELNCRLIGAGAHALVEAVSGVDPVALVVADLLDEAPSLPCLPVARAAVQLYLVSDRAGRVAALPDPARAAALPGLLGAETHVAVGADARPVTSSSDYLGAVLTTGRDREQALGRAQHAARVLAVRVEEPVHA
ncbi:MAG: Protein of unknown function, putative Glutathione synthetase ATP-binding domain [Frankiales bacterium]|nr:Protein of unknown function, putative Glutathione synthetase ATP-binding domain [Frankiales bacterium]